MECNKEEAIRAKEVAEKKMQNRDFIGAKKMVLKAQQLFPELENISQMLTVCDVHCSAGIKVNGEMDLYGILKLEPTADDSAIKKQYHKLALSLHPDKNQFPGAEAAFKLIGEAQMTLKDKLKRYTYDMKRNGGLKPSQPKHKSQQSAKTSYSRTNSAAYNFNGLNQQQPSASTNPTFWTMCPKCNIKYQYYRAVLKRLMHCQNCQNTFIAEEVTQPVPTGASSGQSSFAFRKPQSQIPVQQAKSMNYQNHVGNPKEHRAKVASVDSDGKAATQHGKEDRGEKAAKPSTGSAGKKRQRNMIADSSDSESSDNDRINLNERSSPMNPNVSTARRRRSERLKQKVAYTDGNGDDKSFEHTISPETAIGKTTTQGSEQTLPDGKADGTVGSGVKGTKVLNDGVENKKKEGISSAGLSNENVIYEDGAEVGKGDTGVQVRTLTYPDPEFCDFDYRFRSASKFSIDQIWAVYDGLDGMPRFYARIKKIFVPLFEVHYTWLEHNPRNEAEEVWDEKELPVACGNFKLGKTESSTDLLMFSHIVCWEKGKRKNSYDIYPKKGEVWALFKGWNMEWRSDGDKNRKYRYEVVEVVSDFAPEKGISIIPLVKIKGFVSLFMHATGLINPVVIPASETHRFSHSVPSYRLTRKVKGVPQGSLELDTASLPEDYGETSPSIILDRTTGRVKKLDECHKSILTDESKEEVRSRIYNVYRGSSKAAGCVKEDQARRSHTLVHSDTEQLQTKTDEKNSHDGKGTNGENSVEECVFFPAYGMHGFTYDYPDPEFHNFDEARRIRNFSCGQIWALYCDIDRYPKYYGLVKKVDVEEHRVHVVWLEACPTKEEEKRWLNEELPISCGTFKVFQDTMTFEDADAFSHVVHAKAVDGKKNKHYIYPNCGEIWAIYKNWKPGWRKRDLHRCDYDVVEICETTGFSIKVRLLEKVSGYRTVFKCKGTGIAVTTIDIPFGDYIKFSHQIPAFMLTNEKGGKLRGYWELDPAAVPELLLISGF